MEVLCEKSRSTISKVYERSAALDDSVLTMRLGIALDELEALRCRMIDISSTLDALDEVTGGENIVFCQARLLRNQRSGHYQPLRKERSTMDKQQPRLIKQQTGSGFVRTMTIRGDGVDE